MKNTNTNTAVLEAKKVAKKVSINNQKQLKMKKAEQELASGFTPEKLKRFDAIGRIWNEGYHKTEEISNFLQRRDNITLSPRTVYYYLQDLGLARAEFISKAGE